MNNFFSIIPVIYLTLLWFLSIYGVGVDLVIFGLPSQRVALILTGFFVLLNFLKGNNLKLDTKSIGFLYLYFALLIFFMILSIRILLSIETYPFLTDWHLQNFNGVILAIIIYISFFNISDSVFLCFMKKYFPLVVLFSAVSVVIFNRDIFDALSIGGERITTDMRLGSSRAINNINYWAMSMGGVFVFLFYISDLKVRGWLAIAALGLCLALTLSRSGILIAILAIFLPVLRTLSLRNIMVLFLFIIFMCVAFTFFGDGIFAQRISSVFTGSDRSTIGRLSVYIELFENYSALFGYGSDYSKVISHPTESFVISSFISLGPLAVVIISLFIFFNFQLSNNRSLVANIRHFPPLLLLTWFFDDPFLSLSSALSLITYQRLVCIKQNEPSIYKD